MSNYTAKAGETITDVILNTTGSLIYWPQFLDANNLDTWTPYINAGDILIIPDVLADQNTTRDLAIYPASNGLFNPADINAQIAAITSLFIGGASSLSWILAKKTWNDTAQWIDSQAWNDGP